VQLVRRGVAQSAWLELLESILGQLRHSVPAMAEPVRQVVRNILIDEERHAFRNVHLASHEVVNLGAMVVVVRQALVHGAVDDQPMDVVDADPGAVDARTRKSG
jgi:hypothetical protein